MAIKLTTSWQLVAEGTSKVTSNCTGYVRLYMKYAPINSSTDRIYYEIRQLAHNPYGRYLGWEWTGNINWSIVSGSTTRASGSFTQSAIYSTDDETDLTKEILRVGNTDNKGDKYYDVSRNSDGTYSDTFTFKAPVYQSTVTVKDVAITLPPYYTLTVNGNLDGTVNSNVSGYGAFTVSLNGGAASSRLTSYSTKHLEGTTYSIDFYPGTGKTYDGLSAGARTGTLNSNVTVTAKFNSIKYTISYTLNSGTNSVSNPTTGYYGNTITLSNPTRTGYTFTGWTSSNVTISSGKFTMPASNVTVVANWTPTVYTNGINHWARGFLYKEGNNGNKNLFKLGDTTFEQAYGTTITYDASKAMTLPNGFVVSKNIGSSSFSSSWTTYTMPAKLTQPAKIVHMQYDYEPISYLISYDLKGGKNPSSNPTYYNVLYGVTFSNPTKQGYIFKGWTTTDGKPITGINEGKNASFSSATDLYNQVATRTTGDITIVANWELNAASIHKKVNGNWIKGVAYVKINDKWNIASRIFTKVNNEWVESKK